MARRLDKKETAIVIERLREAFPDARAELDFSNPFELLIATILSAQCTDVRVNKVTKNLFNIAKKPEDYLKLGFLELSDIIHSCGFYQSKAKNILGACQMIIDDFDGEVPDTIEDLMKLPGVGKKTANVVASNAFGIPAIAVDTHVFRVSNRMGIAKATTVEKTEAQLQRMIPKNLWTLSHHLMIFQGRRVCKARRPLCAQCTVTDLCKYEQKELS
ncbi:MAG: endonuclease III [Tissierellia bacterium]|nr:endonuclease III [Tissierellia bacterium]